MCLSVFWAVGSYHRYSEGISFLGVFRSCTSSNLNQPTPVTESIADASSEANCKGTSKNCFFSWPPLKYCGFFLLWHCVAVTCAKGANVWRSYSASSWRPLRRMCGECWVWENAFKKVAGASLQALHVHVPFGSRGVGLCNRKLCKLWHEQTINC